MYFLKKSLYTVLHQLNYRNEKMENLTLKNGLELVKSDCQIGAGNGIVYQCKGNMYFKKFLLLDGVIMGHPSHFDGKEWIREQCNDQLQHVK